MSNMIVRSDRRAESDIRLIKIHYGVFEYASGSVLFEQGQTKILCAVSMQNQVPHFLKGKKEGWLTCEYSLLPMSTQIRSQRESSMSQRNGRCVEISRFVGRALRTVIDFSVFPEKTIIVDCDVLQADGATRVSSINAASIALQLAQDYWLKNKIIDKPFLLESLYAVSVGVLKDKVFVDLNCLEDNEAIADFNFVLTGSNRLVEILGGAEKRAITLGLFSEVQLAALGAVERIQKEITILVSEYFAKKRIEEEKNNKVPLFSLQNRLLEKE